MKATKFFAKENANGNIAFTLKVTDDGGQAIYIERNIAVTAVNDVPVTENGRLVTVIEDSGISDAGFDIDYSSGGGEDEANQEIRIAFNVSELRGFNASGYGGKLVRISGSQSIEIASEELSGNDIVFLTAEQAKEIRFVTNDNEFGTSELDYFIVDSEIFSKDPEGNPIFSANSFLSGNSINNGLKQSLKVRVVEFNDIPSFTGLYNYSGDEGLSESISGQVKAVDTNSSQGLTYSNAGRPLEGFTIDENGNWNLDTTGVTYQRINEGVVNTFTTYIAATDIKGASSIQELTFNIEGVNNNPIATYTRSERSRRCF